jgi:hypothetical protein
MRHAHAGITGDRHLIVGRRLEPARVDDCVLRGVELGGGRQHDCVLRLDLDRDRLGDGRPDRHEKRVRIWFENDPRVAAAGRPRRLVITATDEKACGAESGNAQDVSTCEAIHGDRSA